jgi:hypothetical protein
MVKAKLIAANAKAQAPYPANATNAKALVS